MNIIVNEIFNHPILTNGKKQVYRKVVEGATIEECFKGVYKLERGARYNNFVHHEIVDTDLAKEYREWCKTGITIDLFYGNATID